MILLSDIVTSFHYCQFMLYQDDLPAICLDGPDSLSPNLCRSSAACCSSHDMTFAWNLTPVLVAALGNIRSSGSSASSALVYSLLSALSRCICLPEVTPWPSSMRSIWSIRVDGDLVLLLPGCFGFRRSNVRLIQILFVLNVLMSLHSTW